MEKELSKLANSHLLLFYSSANDGSINRSALNELKFCPTTQSRHLQVDSVWLILC